MLYNSLSPHQKQKLEHRCGRLGKQSRLHFWSEKSATWPIGRSYHVLCKAQMSCSALSNLYSPLLGRRDKWTQSGRCWGEFLRKRGSAALEHLSPPTRPWSGQACLTPSTCCPWKGPLHIPHPPFHQQIFHQGWRMADIRENYSVERYLLRNFEISKMSPPKRYSSSRVWFISSLTMLEAFMLLLSIWKDLSSFQWRTSDTPTMFWMSPTHVLVQALRSGSALWSKEPVSPLHNHQATGEHKRRLKEKPHNKIKDQRSKITVPPPPGSLGTQREVKHKNPTRPKVVHLHTAIRDWRMVVHKQKYLGMYLHHLDIRE